MAMMTFSPITPTQRGVEMFERRTSKSLFFEVVDTQRMSVVTDFENDDDEEIYSSDIDSATDETPDSPRGSFDSAGKFSNSSASTPDELPTPRISQDGGFSKVQIHGAPSVQGPRGPHLFRISYDSVQELNFENALQLSPITKAPELPFQQVRSPLSTVSTVRPNLPRPAPQAQNEGLRTWTTTDVAQWLASYGFDESIVQIFESQDVNGSVVMSLDFQDLQTLGVSSFGKRFELWNHILNLRQDSGSAPHTPIQEDVDVPMRRTTNKKVKPRRQQRTRSKDQEAQTPRTARLERNADDTILPGESISIVAVEQLLPKPHKCSKGEDCSKFRKQQRLLAQLEKDHCFPISPEDGGHIWIAGNPGNADNATRLLENVYKDNADPNATLGGLSEGPSLVPSSDAMGCGNVPSMVLAENSLDGVETRDPQENVRKFLEFQHLQIFQEDEPTSPQISTPGLDMFPPSAVPRRATLQQLPRLSIPNGGGSGSSLSQVTTLSPFRPQIPNSPARAPLRRGTPASEMDVPIITVETISRENSQSVPANMQFRSPVVKPHPRVSALSAVPENAPQTPLTALGPMPNAYGDSTTYAGWMKKRKNKVIRHEWNDRHFRLNGTQLAMHATAAVKDHKVLESIDVDHYAVACSSLGSTSKLAAAFKAMRITGGKRTSVDDTAFAFQLVPESGKGRVVDYLMDGKKTHHFAVTTRDDRIDWMRELMLAKALKQKQQGYRVTLNGVLA